MVAYSFKKQFIDPILVGLGVQVHHEPGGAHVYHPKRQTIRAIGKRRHARPGETIQLYTAMRTKQCRKLGEARCVSVEPISVWIEPGRVAVEGHEAIDGIGLDDFARLDGFASWSDMATFWMNEHGQIVRAGPFVGVLIKWERIDG
jgi:hypothetical protein